VSTNLEVRAAPNAAIDVPGIYLPNRGDHFTVSSNRLHHNDRCGPQVNGDLTQGGAKVISIAVSAVMTPSAGDQADVLYGGCGYDDIAKGNGFGRLWGEVGNDTRRGGPGLDTLDGGPVTTTASREISSTPAEGDARDGCSVSS
jgi:hypothetical protein